MITSKLLSILTFLAVLLDKRHRLMFECMREENLILREHIHVKYKTKRIILTKRQKKRLAVKAKPLGRKLIGETTDMYQPDTYLKWYIESVAKKYDSSVNRKGGRPKISQEKIDWVLKMAEDKTLITRSLKAKTSPFLSCMF